ncbi:uncharacterized protein LOC132636808 isoform X2 [Lycium barbarum]|uniref:uncharacterized protein LOC132636808 isoform X2 n=1 Tax=Lycium barbarum TaxID=112863 RepID=UPI00293E9FF9|nr:uncharacterized protein LOC132636808 isoform X2 [Lycium barbarum]
MDSEMMKAVPGTDFETFLSDLMEERSEDESMLDMMKQNDLDALALKSVSFLSSSHDDMHSLEKWAYLLSRLLKVDDDLCTWRNLSTSTQSAIKSFLLNPINNFEESQFISKVHRYTIYRLAASLLPDNSWPELLPFLPSAKTLHSLFRNTLNDDTVDLNVRIVAMKAVIRFIQRMSSSNEKERFEDLLPGMMKTLTDAYLSKGEEDQVADEQPLALFIELAKNEPRFFRRQLVDVVATMFDIAEDKGLKEETTNLAVEFLMTLVEAKNRAPGMIKRVPLFISRCFAMLLKLLLYIKDDPAWHSALDASDDTGATSYYSKGKKCLDRFSLALGGKSIAHVAIEQLSAYSAAPEWEKRHAALIALGQIAEGCSKVMIKNLDQVMAMVLNCFQDPHPRVKCAACYAVCRLLVDFSPHLQEKYHNQVLLALAAAMDDFHPRVQAHAAAALCHFRVPGKPETLIHRLDGLVNKLLVHLKNGKQIVQQEALKALAFISGSVEGHFRTCYDAVMPHLKTLLRNADFQSNLIVLSCAMECISCVVMAVGKEKFRDDEKQVMEMLMSLQAKVDDPTTTKYLLHACCRICECMGKDFLPYMNVVMPFLLQCAQLNTISMEQYNENYKVDANSKETLEMKAKACRLLCWYAETLKENFYPWISQAVSILVPLQKFYTHRLVRESAVEGLHFLLCSAKLAVEKGVAQEESESYFTKLSNHIILALVEALHKEFETEMCVVMLRELNGCLQICESLLTEGQARSIVDEIKHVITDSSSRKQELKEREKMEDFDAEEAELLTGESEQEEKVFENARYILRTLIRTFKSSFLPFLDVLSSYLLPMWAKEKTTTERSSSICIFDNLMEECPEAALKYYDSGLPLILDASNDEDPDVRQAALYGLGLWAEHGRSSFKPFVGAALSRINVVIMHLRAREHENERAYDNAVSALGKICQFHWESFDSAEAIPAWLNCLPIKADLEEAKDVHKQLCSMIERSYRELLGPNYQYLPKVVSVFIEVLCAGEVLATEDTAKRMTNLLRHFQHTLPPATWESAQSLLLPQQEMKLESIVSPED